MSAAPPSPRSARTITRAGALVGAFVAVAGAGHGSGLGASWAQDLPWMAIFAIAAVALGGAGARVLDGALLGMGAGAMRAELARGNVAAGVVTAAHRVAMGVVAARCMYGADFSSLVVSALFMALALGTLLGFEALHRRLTRYADDQEVRGENLAAALSCAGLTLALAIIVGHAAEGTFLGWAASLRAYGLALLLAVGLYPVRQVLVKRLLLGLPDARLDRAIAEERDAVIGAAEGLAYLATALLVTGLL